MSSPFYRIDICVRYILVVLAFEPNDETQSVSIQMKAVVSLLLFFHTIAAWYIGLLFCTVF